MLKMGYDVALANSAKPGGGEIKLGAESHRIIPWEEAMGPDRINVIHSDIPPVFHKLGNRVFWAHGTPRHVFLYSYMHGGSALEVSAYLVDRCELVIVTNPNYIPYWQELTDDPDKIKFVPGGVDVDRFKPEGKAMKFTGKPSVGYLDPIRVGVKDPFDLMFAVKKLGKTNPNIKLILGGVRQEKLFIISYLAGRLKLDANLETVIVGMYPNVTEIYRGLDILVSPVEGGTVSTVAAEAMACGCPAITLEGSDMPSYMKCRPDPESMAEAIETLWAAIQADRDSVRERAREIAVKHYNIEETARRFVEELEGRFAPA